MANNQTTNDTVNDGAAQEGVDGHDNNDRARRNPGHEAEKKSGGNSGAGRSGTEGLGSEKSGDGLGSEMPHQR